MTTKVSFLYGVFKVVERNDGRFVIRGGGNNSMFVKAMPSDGNGWLLTPNMDDARVMTYPDAMKTARKYERFLRCGQWT